MYTWSAPHKTAPLSKKYNTSCIRQVHNQQYTMDLKIITMYTDNTIKTKYNVKKTILQHNENCSLYHSFSVTSSGTFEMIYYQPVDGSRQKEK